MLIGWLWFGCLYLCLDLLVGVVGLTRVSCCVDFVDSLGCLLVCRWFVCLIFVRCYGWLLILRCWLVCCF